jgi:BirA family biotin operon repressor/biotin-[acetyl-CoA-carboxylase] ligase
MDNFKIENTIVKETVSTNALAKELMQNGSHIAPFFVQTDFQTDGRGQYTKSWESNAKENLLFSLVIQPKNIQIEKQFSISKLVAVSILQVLQVSVKGLSIKWPNDIYIENRKIAGILIENTIVGQNIENCIIGIGLNVNQTKFSKDLPNPISLKSILSKDTDINLLRDQIISKIFQNLNHINLVDNIYLEYLYRKGELSLFKDTFNNVFLGVILGVNDIGQLTIRVENNQKKHFSNSEIEYILPETNL